MKRSLSLFLVALGVAVALALPYAWRYGIGGSEDWWFQNHLRFSVRSSAGLHEPGKPVPLLVRIHNTGPEPYLMKAGAVELRFEGQAAESRWSAPETMLAPGQSRQLLDVTWVPPLSAPEGTFIIRFDGKDRPTRFTVAWPRHE